MNKMVRNHKINLVLIVIAILLVICILLNNDFFKKKYTCEDFGIEKYTSSVDKDNDGIDDQTDILNGAKAYLNTRPRYKSKYYSSGYPDDGYGVCTDVIVNGLLAAGYEIRELLNDDILLNPSDYDISKVDKNIDFRRVVNLEVYFKKYYISLTTDTNNISEWQAGDIVVWNHHVGIISDRRNENGIPYVLHNGSPYQLSYEQDVLESYGIIIGHYRVS